MRRPAAIALAVVVGGALGAATTTAAEARTVPIEADFGILLPGQVANASTEVTVPVASAVTDAAWTRLDGQGTWTAELCADEDCTDLDELAGRSVPAGDYRVVIEVTMADSVDGPAATSAQGRILLAALPELPLTDGSLALTGASPWWTGVVVGGLLAGGGAALLARRRSDRSTS